MFIPASEEMSLLYYSYWGITLIRHHNLLLESLLIECKMLIIKSPRKPKQPKETNWKQKFQKPQNENICLTYLNTENKRNSHFLSFCCALQMVQNLQRWTSLSFQQSGWIMMWLRFLPCKISLKAALYSNFIRNYTIIRNFQRYYK